MDLFFFLFLQINYTESENPINLSSNFDTPAYNNVDFIQEIRKNSLKN